MFLLTLSSTCLQLLNWVWCKELIPDVLHPLIGSRPDVVNKLFHHPTVGGCFFFTPEGATSFTHTHTHKHIAKGLIDTFYCICFHTNQLTLGLCFLPLMWLRWSEQVEQGTQVETGLQHGVTQGTTETDKDTLLKVRQRRHNPQLLRGNGKCCWCLITSFCIYWSGSDRKSHVSKSKTLKSHSAMCVGDTLNHFNCLCSIVYCDVELFCC